MGRVMLIIPTFLGVYTLLMTKTRGAIIGVLIGGVLLAALLYSIKKNNVKKTVLMILVSLAIVGCIGAVTVQSFHRSYDYERVLLLKSSYAMWEDHKLYGVGFRHWAREYPNYISPAAREPDLTIPHNVIASFFDETGIIGGFGFLLLVFGTLIIL
ncbi:O-antigen ligase family protein, partial [Mitsuokella jalaludinii]